MKKWWKKPRRIVVGGAVWRWSLVDHPRYQELRVYHEERKQLAFRLRLTWPETWGIDLFRPRTVACVIAWYVGQGRREPACLTLQEEPELFRELVELCFRPEEAQERGRFLKWIKLTEE